MDNNELYEYVKDLKNDIKDVKTDVKDVKNDVKDVMTQVEDVYSEVIKINERLTNAETDIYIIKEQAKLRTLDCSKKINDLTPIAPLMRHLNWLVKNPKLTVFGLIFLVVVIQTIVLEAIQEGWLFEIFNFISP